jgi:hypothetical protein
MPSYCAAEASIRVLELESRCAVYPHRGFEAHSLRQCLKDHNALRAARRIQTRWTAHAWRALQTRCKHFGTALGLAYSNSAFDPWADSVLGKPQFRYVPGADIPPGCIEG